MSSPSMRATGSRVSICWPAPKASPGARHWMRKPMMGRPPSSGQGNLISRKPGPAVTVTSATTTCAGSVRVRPMISHTAPPPAAVGATLLPAIGPLATFARHSLPSSCTTAFCSYSREAAYSRTPRVLISTPRP